MGGLGSGRRPSYPGTLADCRALRVADVPRERLVAALEEADGMTPAVTVDGVALALLVRPQPLGGRRAWWACPWCARPCATLYAPRSGVPRWTCRRCLGWPYPSQREGAAARADRRARRLAARLGEPFPWLADALAAPPPRPPRMHRRTYARLREAWETVADAAEMAWLARALRVTCRVMLR